MNNGNEEIQLIENAILGDAGAFEKLCELKSRMVLKLSISILKDYHDSEDVAQEVMLIMQNGIGKLKSASSLDAWLYRVTVRTCSEILNKKKYEKKIVREEAMEYEITIKKESDFPYEAAEKNERYTMLKKIVDRLPDKQRMCVSLYYIEGLSYKEISDAMDVSENTVGSMLAKARKKIEKNINKNRELKTYLQGAYGTAMLPAFGNALKVEMDSLVTEEVSKTFARSFLTKSATAKSSLTASSGISTVMKTLIGVTVSTGIVVSVIVGYTNALDNADAQQTLDQPLSSAIVEDIVPQDNSFPDNAEEGFDKKIKTLEDMIGPKKADMLRSYVPVITESVIIESFLDEIEMAEHRRGMDTASDEIYTLYTLIKQDKLLMVITRDGGDGKLGVSFHFTISDEPLPRNIEIIQSYENWK